VAPSWNIASLVSGESGASAIIFLNVSAAFAQSFFPWCASPSL
jgi:hypothetical protein